MVDMIIANDIGTNHSKGIIVSSWSYPVEGSRNATGDHRTHELELLVQSHRALACEFDVIHPEYARNEGKRYLG